MIIRKCFCKSNAFRFSGKHSGLTLNFGVKDKTGSGINYFYNFGPK
jgi:hypothetical protein